MLLRLAERLEHRLEAKHSFYSFVTVDHSVLLVSLHNTSVSQSLDVLARIYT